MKEITIKPIFNAAGHRIGDYYFHAGKLIGLDTIGPFVEQNTILNTNSEVVQMTLQNNGAGDCLVMPEMDFSDDKDDPIVRVRKHLVAQHGEAAAMEKLRAMNGLQVLQLAEQLASGKTGDDPNDNSMPAMKW